MIETEHAGNYCTSYDLIKGGELQRQTTIFDTFRQTIFEQQKPHSGEDMVKQQYEILKNQSNRLNCPVILNSQEASFDDVALHALLRQRLKVGTVEKRIRYARFMENHVVPVDFRNPNYTNFIRHMDYREQIEQVGQSALSHEWKTMKMFLKAYGTPLTDWNYRPPTCPQAKARIIPLPDTVHKMIHHKYSDDEYENALIQYTLMHTFMIGWRNPSETCIMTVDDVKIDEGILIVTEPKKSKSSRVVMPGKALMTGKTRKSFKNWIEKWRPKVANQHSGNALYLKLDGHPIEIDQYRMFITRHIRPIFPDYQPYVSRHWCAIGRLIKAKLETKNFDIYDVKDWLGHEEIQTTMTYVRDAKQYLQIAPYDWFRYILKCR